MHTFRSTECFLVRLQSNHNTKLKYPFESYCYDYFKDLKYDSRGYCREKCIKEGILWILVNLLLHKLIQLLTSPSKVDQDID